MFLVIVILKCIYVNWPYMFGKDIFSVLLVNVVLTILPVVKIYPSHYTLGTNIFMQVITSPF